MLACYGPASAAKEVIGKVNRMHGKVKGATPAGDKYRALDPLLLDCVAATASYGFLMAYDRFVHVLSEADKDRFMADGDAIGREFGARRTPPTVAAFMDMMAELEPRFEAHPIIFEFLDRSEEHTSELQSLMRISYAVFFLNKKNNKNIEHNIKH